MFASPDHMHRACQILLCLCLANWLKCYYHTNGDCAEKLLSGVGKNQINNIFFLKLPFHIFFFPFKSVVLMRDSTVFCFYRLDCTKYITSIKSWRSFQLRIMEFSGTRLMLVNAKRLNIQLYHKQNVFRILHLSMSQKSKSWNMNHRF